MASLFLTSITMVNFSFSPIPSFIELKKKKKESKVYNSQLPWLQVWKLADPKQQYTTEHLIKLNFKILALILFYTEQRANTKPTNQTSAYNKELCTDQTHLNIPQFAKRILLRMELSNWLLFSILSLTSLLINLSI